MALAAAAWAAALAMRGAPLGAGALGAAAALLRPNGLLIALPIALLARGRSFAFKLAAAAPVAAGAAVHLFFWARSGDVAAFPHAQRLWDRRGPGGIGDWAGQVWSLLDARTPLVGFLAVAGIAGVALVWRRYGRPAAIAVVSGCVVLLALAAGDSLQVRLDTARYALAVPLLVVLWRLGPRYRPWAAYAIAVVATLLVSGLIASFGRQILFAFPIFWALADGPAWLRRPPLAALGFASNLVLALLLTRFAP